MFAQICVVEDGAIHLDILTLEFRAIWDHPPFHADAASATGPSQSGNLAITSITSTEVMWDAHEPCSVKTA